MPSTQRKRKNTPNYETWDIQIADWEYDYSFGINQSKGDPNIYSEHPHLTLTGKVIEPTAKRGRPARVYIIFRRELDKVLEDYTTGEINSYIGEITTRIEAKAVLNLPQQNSVNIVQLLTAGVYKYISLHGLRQGRSGVGVQYVRFSRNAEE